MLETTVRIKPVDRDGPSIVIFKEANSGKVAIGRGEFLRCADKKVSRVHAELELDVDGQLHLTPLHVNPCFYFRGGDEQSREEVRKGDNKILNGGDHFSLLSNSYVYKVDVERVGSADDTIKKEKLSNGGSKLLDDDTEPISSKFNTTGENCRVKKINAQRQTSNNNAETDYEEPEKIHSVETGNETRKRTLPAWLVEAAAAAQSVDKRQAGPSASSSKATKKKQPAKSSPVKSNDKIKPKDKPSTSRRQSFSDSNDNESVDSVIENTTKTSTNNVKEESSEKSDAKTTKNSKVRNDEKKRRASCRFGDECFRKNPVHLEEFSHPGDPDYSLDSKVDDEAESEEIAVDPNDPRPECEYGLKCYRKNTQHRLDYKHTSRPRTQRNAAKEAKKRTSRRDAGSDDSNDSFEDSFIDDDDSDEYRPSQDAADYSDDDCEEDLKRLKKEADSFVKNKKFHKMA